MSPSEAVDRRSWSVWSWVGALPAMLLQYWMLTAGTWNLFRWNRGSDFYDAQAHAWLDGRWSINERILGIESFFHDGQAYMYQGPVPAVLRLPVAVFTDRLDGRLTAASMLLGCVVVAWACSRLGWQIRRLIGVEAVLRRAERVTAALMSCSVVGGSCLLFASSRAWVYHEAIIWGVAFTLASAAYLVEWIHDRRVRAFWCAAAFAGLALLTRASVGGGALAAVVLSGACDLSALLSVRVAAGSRLHGWLRRLSWNEPRAAGVASLPAEEMTDQGESEESVPLPSVGDRLVSSWRWFSDPVVATCAIVAAYVAVNYVKFGSLVKVPFESQGFTLVDPDRQHMLAVNGGSLFSAKFAPTTLLQYWRPDMLGFSTRFPFIGFPERPITNIGGLQFDLLDKTASVPATLPHLVVLALIGSWAIVRGRSAARMLRVPMVGALAGTIAVVNIGYTANRYQSDFLPLVVIGAWAGLFVLIAWWPEQRVAVRRATVSMLIAGGVFALLANLALGYFFQRAYAPSTAPELIAGYLDTVLDVDSALGDGKLDTITIGDELPDSGRLGDIFVVSDCSAVYWSDGMQTNAVKRTNWNGALRTEAGGAVDYTVTFEDRPAGTREELFIADGGAEAALVYVEYVGDGRIRLGYDGPGLDMLDRAIDIDFGTAYHLHGWFDPLVHEVNILLDDRLFLVTGFEGQPPLRAGGSAGGAERGFEPFSGSMHPRVANSDLCRRLLAAAT